MSIEAGKLGAGGEARLWQMVEAARGKLDIAEDAAREREEVAARQRGGARSQTC